MSDQRTTRRGRHRFGGAAAVVALMSVSVGTRADDGFSFMDGNDLHRLCQSGDRFGDGGCFGFANAVADVLAANNPINSFTACFPLQTKTRRVEGVVKDYLAAHPEKRDQAASGLVAEALAEAFPCLSSK